MFKAKLKNIRRLIETVCLRTIYIHVCYLLSSQKVIDREFGNLLLIKDNHEKFVVSIDDIKFSNYEGVKHIHPWELR